MRTQVFDDLNNLYPEMKKMRKIYSAKFGEIDLNKFHESCKYHEITLSLAKTNFNKVIGLLCPIKYMNRGKTPVTGGKTLIIYFDDQEIRKCT